MSETSTQATDADVHIQDQEAAAPDNGAARPDTAQDGAESVDGPKGNREARYRVERNSARQERDALAARLESLQTAEIHRLAGEELSQPADLLTLGGVSLADLLDEVGNVDTAAVADAITRLVESRPGLSRNPKVLATDATQGMGGGNGKPKADWKTFLNIQ